MTAPYGLTDFMIDRQQPGAQSFGRESLQASPIPVRPEVLVKQVRAATLAARSLRLLGAAERSMGLRAMAAALDADQNEILEANTLDLEASQEMAVPSVVQTWLKLTPERLQAAITILRELARTHDPILQVMPGQSSLQDAQVYGQRMPWGVVALVSEAFPALGAIAAGLCLRTANALIVRGGSETSHSNRAIFRSLQQALETAALPVSALTLVPVEQGISIQEVLTQPGLDLLLPYGRRSLVRQALAHSVAPVIAPGIGNCCLYWSGSAPSERVRRMLIESHYGEPEPVNALEKVLVPTAVKLPELERLWQELQQAGFKVCVDEALSQKYPALPRAAGPDWGKASHSRKILFRVAQDLSAAIAWINQYSNGHADAIATSSYEESRQFAAEVASASIYINASPKFERNPGSGIDIALGMASQASTGIGNIRGRIGLDALTRMSQIILG